ncbi:unnamed protein product [Adineta steineri]|uniref:G-protein coupled receptors family 1 profile domain-containing protein n=1 Tax=Adineta steineri TaxID=433720 RepID=A0A819XAB2_9BILA|nr:unnamed protein product [Adineta steineri]CAF4133151.1 unnamed protein product [Adineta steineri]
MNSTTVESWFIPLDILAIICLALTIALATIALIIIIMDKTCHTVPMLLTANICLTGLLCGIDTIGMNGFTLYNDLKQIEYEDSFCFIIGFFNYSTCALHNYSYVTSAIYRYITIVHPTRLFWQSARAQIILIGIGWFLALLFPIVYIFTNAIVYNVDNQICQVPLGFSFLILYAPLFIYIVPVHLVIFIYMKLVRFVRGMSQRVTAANTLSRAQRDLKMVRRVVTLVQILFISGFPLSLFIFLSFFNHAPKYHFRIGFLFVNASMLLVKITLFQFTDPLKAAIKKILRRRLNIVLPIPAITRSLT